MGYPVADIDVGKRHCKALGNIDNLAASIAAVGLLHPIVITPDGVLIAGERRLAAVKLLGWVKVPVTTISIEMIVCGEAAENLQRKDFTPTEAVAIKRAVEPAERDAAKERMVAAHASPGKLPEQQRGEARDKVADFTGYGARTLDKAEEPVSHRRSQWSSWDVL